MMVPSERTRCSDTVLLPRPSFFERSPSVICLGMSYHPSSHAALKTSICRSDSNELPSISSCVIEVAEILSGRSIMRAAVTTMRMAIGLPRMM